jgi:hypothetical protein
VDVEGHAEHVLRAGCLAVPSEMRLALSHAAHDVQVVRREGVERDERPIVVAAGGQLTPRIRPAEHERQALAHGARVNDAGEALQLVLGVLACPRDCLELRPGPLRKAPDRPRRIVG